MTAFEGREADTAAREHSDALDGFLRGVERRALRMAEFAAGNREEALDLVQDAMFGFVRNYASPARPRLGRRCSGACSTAGSTIGTAASACAAAGASGRSRLAKRDEDPIAAAPDAREPGPLARLADGEASAALEAGLRALPLRQRQAFLLRLWEGLDVADTAAAMRCSEGSVKTHLSRALSNLRRVLGEHE